MWEQSLPSLNSLRVLCLSTHTVVYGSEACSMAMVIAQWVKCSPCKLDDRSPVLRTPVKKMLSAVCAESLESSTGKQEANRSLDSAANQPCFTSEIQVKERSCLKQTKRKGKRNKWTGARGMASEYCPLMFVSMCTHANAHTCTHREKCRVPGPTHTHWLRSCIWIRFWENSNVC